MQDVHAEALGAARDGVADPPAADDAERRPGEVGAEVRGRLPRAPAPLADHRRALRDVGHAQRDRSGYDLLTGDCVVEEAVVATRVPRLDLIPATVDLSGAEIELVDIAERTHRLDKALAAAPSARWDVCLIDCPPSLGLLTINALVAAQSILVPLQAEFFALEGLSQLLQTIERIRARFNPELVLRGSSLALEHHAVRTGRQIS